MIGGRLVLHGAHTVRPAIPPIPTTVSLIAVPAILVTVTVTVTGLPARRSADRAPAEQAAGRTSLQTSGRTSGQPAGR